MLSDEELIEIIELSLKEPDISHDIERHSKLTRSDAYRLQIKRKMRLADGGDPHVGYRISMSSKVGSRVAAELGLIPKELADTTSPVFTGLSLSNIGSEDSVVCVDPDRWGFVEGEIGVLLNRRLSGPGVTPASALACIAGFFPVIDLAQIPHESAYSLNHKIASMAGPLDSICMIGSQLAPPSLNLPLEGMVVSINGEHRASATAWECMGSPVNAVAWLANTISEVGYALEPGQIIVTGVCTYPQALKPGDMCGRLECTNLGSVSVRVSVPGSSSVKVC